MELPQPQQQRQQQSQEQPQPQPQRPQQPQQQPQQQPLASCSWRRFVQVNTVVSSGALLACLALNATLRGHWSAVTATHCRSREFLPSVSSATGDLTPERYVWRCGVSLFVFQRFLDAVLQLQHYRRAARKPPSSSGLSVASRWLNTGKFVAMVSEYACMLLLTCVSSRENHGMHEAGFVGFQLSAMVHMPVALALYKRTHGARGRCWRWMRACVLANFALVACAAAAFAWHRQTCADWAYSVFAVFEWLTVASNIAFHYSTVWVLEGLVLEARGGRGDHRDE